MRVQILVEIVFKKSLAGDSPFESVEFKKYQTSKS